ncbi:MAG: helix-turn-helix transcriptional regulator [Pyrinomonadaceae bacterium]|nr:helix-turn-helix transcriptional regulator [Pyrinomonadaceae bacterium]
MQAKDKSLLALSEETGISYNTLHRIKKNTVQGITYDVLEKICLNLDCTPNDLLVIEK